MIHLVRRRPRLEREGDGTVEFGIGKAFCALLRRVWTRLESLLNCFPFERNQLRCEIVDVLERTGVRTWRSVIMVRNKPAGDAFASNRRSPALVRRKRELELKAEQEGNELATGVRRSLPSASRIADESMSGPAEVSVRRKDGCFEVKGNISMAGDPDVTYDILADHENNPHIFKTLSKVEVEYKDDMKLVTQHAHWNLMFWSGNFDIKLKVEEDRSKRVIAFELTEPGFLKLFSGQWGIEPWIQEGKQVGSKVMVTQEVLPSILPPGPLGGYVSRIMGNQVKAALQDLSAEAERLQQCKRSNAK